MDQGDAAGFDQSVELYAQADIEVLVFALP
jgi:hypothetical protein